MTTFMNLMVVLVPFLLITAVFSRIAIVELDLPSAQSVAPSNPTFFDADFLADMALLKIEGGRVFENDKGHDEDTGTDSSLQ